MYLIFNWEISTKILHYLDNDNNNNNKNTPLSLYVL